MLYRYFRASWEPLDTAYIRLKNYYRYDYSMRRDATTSCIGSYLNNSNPYIQVIDSHISRGSNVCVCVSRSALFFDKY